MEGSVVIRSSWAYPNDFFSTTYIKIKLGTRVLSKQRKICDFFNTVDVVLARIFRQRHVHLGAFTCLFWGDGEYQVAKLISTSRSNVNKWTTGDMNNWAHHLDPPKRDLLVYSCNCKFCSFIFAMRGRRLVSYINR